MSSHHPSKLLSNHFKSTHHQQSFHPKHDCDRHLFRNCIFFLHVTCKKIRGSLIVINEWLMNVLERFSKIMTLLCMNIYVNNSFFLCFSFLFLFLSLSLSLSISFSLSLSLSLSFSLFLSLSLFPGSQRKSQFPIQLAGEKLTR